MKKFDENRAYDQSSAEIKKYEKAWSNRHNCTKQSGHQFYLIKDDEVKKEIRRQFPSMQCALWMCHFCGKVIESM